MALKIEAVPNAIGYIGMALVNAKTKGGRDVSVSLALGSGNLLVTINGKKYIVSMESFLNEVGRFHDRQEKKKKK